MFGAVGIENYVGNDGDLDLVSGSSQGGVQWAENSAREGEYPRLKRFQDLIPAGKQIECGQLLEASDLVGPTSSTRVWVDDVNSDGKLDLLVGDSISLTSPIEGVSREQYGEKLAEWQQKLEVASEKMTAAAANMAESPTEADSEMNSEGGQQSNESSGFGNWLKSLFGGGSEQSPQEKAQQEISNLYQQRSEFMESESTGFVWLYLQK